MPESVCDPCGTECVGEWQYSEGPAGVFQCQHDSTWLIHFTYHPENISNFYPVSLLQGRLDAKTDAAVLDYLLNDSGGIYYICEGPLIEPPKEFQSRHANRYLSALELMSGYASAPTKLHFAVHWLEDQRSPDGTFDLGTVARDMVNLPLSDNRGREGRVTDCTYRVERLLRAIEMK